MSPEKCFILNTGSTFQNIFLHFVYFFNFFSDTQLSKFEKIKKYDHVFSKVVLKHQKNELILLQISTYDIFNA